MGPSSAGLPQPGATRPRRGAAPGGAQAALATDAPSTRAAPEPTQRDPRRFTQPDWDEFVGQYTSQYNEHAFFVADADVEGAIPPELSGTLLRNGPALYEIGGKAIPQPFDGDGMVAQFCFPGGGKAPFFANRFVRTQGEPADEELSLTNMCPQLPPHSPSLPCKATFPSKVSSTFPTTPQCENAAVQRLSRSKRLAR